MEKRDCFKELTQISLTLGYRPVLSGDNVLFISPDTKNTIFIPLDINNESFRIMGLRALRKEISNENINENSLPKGAVQIAEHISEKKMAKQKNPSSYIALVEINSQKMLEFSKNFSAKHKLSTEKAVADTNSFFKENQSQFTKI